jgi:hypothetical protein
MPPDAPAVPLRDTAVELLTRRAGLDHDQAVTVVVVLLPWLVRRLKRLS